MRLPRFRRLQAAARPSHRRGRSQRSAAGGAGHGRHSGPAFLLGLPVSLLIGGLAVTALLGLLLGYALTLTTQSSLISFTLSLNGSAAGNNQQSLPVVTENTLGLEVQQLMDTGFQRTDADFDVPRCLRSQGIADPVLAIEEVSWGAQSTSAWLIVHSPRTIDELRQKGGAVAATVVTPACGRESASPADRLWNGSTMLGANS